MTSPSQPAAPTAPACTGNCPSCPPVTQEKCPLHDSLAHIHHKFIVMSGKGGVGKSTIAVNLAYALALDGRQTGLLDLDVHGPSIPKMLHLENHRPATSPQGRLLPLTTANLKIMSIGFMLPAVDDPVIWRGPIKINVIRQMFTDVSWGPLDALVIDCPPGTGDEPLTICQLLAPTPHVSALLVTTPQQIAATDVAKSINFCRKLQIPLAGLIENMSGFICPHCSTFTPIFSSGAGKTLAHDYAIPFLGSLPLEPAICRSGDNGTPFVADDYTAVSRTFRSIAHLLLPPPTNP